MDISRIKARTSAGTPGRPVRCRLFHVPEQAKAALMPGEHGRWLYDMERRAPAVPALRQPGPLHAINCRESELWTAGTIDHGELVSECDDLQVHDARERTRKRNEWNSETTIDATSRGYRRT